MLFNMFPENTSGLVFLSAQRILGSISFIHLLDSWLLGSGTDPFPGILMM